MNSIPFPAKRRARRIAADEAHSWGRNLRLKNPYAKLVMSMLTLYVNGDGTCFVSIKTLSDDCELAEETVRRRLAWLETVGAITRLPQWLDENGRRNGDGRGKRTTDEIRLMLDTDMDLIEARAAGDLTIEGDAEMEEVSPLHGRGLTEPAAEISPPHGTGLTHVEKTISTPVSPLAAPSLRRGPESSEPEPEDNPPTPQGGKRADLEDHESGKGTWQHAETWARFETAWREPILHQQICRQLWSAFNDGERETAIKAARGYWKWRGSQKRPPNVSNPQKILRETDAWPQFVALAGPDPLMRTFIIENTPGFIAVRVAVMTAGWLPKLAAFDVEQGASGYWRDAPIPHDLLGLAVFGEKPIEQWTTLEPGTVPFKAWSARLHKWFGHWPEKLTVPCLYPPRKDGSIGTSNDDADHPTEMQKTG